MSEANETNTTSQQENGDVNGDVMVSMFDMECEDNGNENDQNRPHLPEPLVRSDCKLHDYMFCRSRCSCIQNGAVSGLISYYDIVLPEHICRFQRQKNKLNLWSRGNDVHIQLSIPSHFRNIMSRYENGEIIQTRFHTLIR